MQPTPSTARTLAAYAIALVTAVSFAHASAAAVRADASGVTTASLEPRPAGSPASSSAWTAELELDAEMLRVFVPDGGGSRPRGEALAYPLRARRDTKARAAWFIRLFQDHGPEPRFGIVRDVVDARVGWLRSEFEGRLLTTLALRANLFDPEHLDSLPASYRLERTAALMVEAVVTLDLRDRPRDPRSGVYARVALHQSGVGAVSSWDYFRFTADLRWYLPLPGGTVLASRFAMGGMLVLDSHGLGTQSVYSLDALGPLSEQLQGGGIGSHRGFRRGGLGGVRRAVTAAGPDGQVVHYRPVLIGGGNRRWEGSVELRVPVTPTLGGVLFADVGSVARVADAGSESVDVAWGFGFRRRTKLGVLRLEWAFRPGPLQHLGDGPLKAACEGVDDVDCRPSPRVAGVPGAFHLAFAEPF